MEQLPLFRRGGKRCGAGRKPLGPQALVSHAARTALTRHTPALVTLRLCAGLPELRCPAAHAVLQRAFAAGGERVGFRMVQYSVLGNHLHCVCEAQNADTLSRGMIGLLVRIARGLNRLWRRKGPVFVDRYHSRILRSPAEVRAALVYVLQNAKKHGWSVTGIDPYSSGPWFDGWSGVLARAGPRPIAEARSWLLRSGWRRHGLIAVTERPVAVRGVA